MRGGGGWVSGTQQEKRYFQKVTLVGNYETTRHLFKNGTTTVSFKTRFTSGGSRKGTENESLRRTAEPLSKWTTVQEGVVNCKLHTGEAAQFSKTFKTKKKKKNGGDVRPKL